MSFNREERRSPSLLVQMQLQSQIGDGTQIIDYFTAKQILLNCLQLMYPVSRLQLNYIKNPISSLLNNNQSAGRREEGMIIYVNPNDRKDFYYQYKEISQEGVDMYSCGGDNDEGEFEQRHPGTNYDSDYDDDDYNSNKKSAHRRDKDLSPINTKAGQKLCTIAFVAPGGRNCEIHAAYELQLTIRIDDQRKCINYDCYEYKPKCRNFMSDALPTNKQIKVYDDIINPTTPKPPSSLYYGYDSDDGNDTDDDDDNDPFWDLPVEPREGLPAFDQEQRKAFHMKAVIGEFFNSRVLRFRISIESIIGARLQVAERNGNDDDDDIASVLILELDQSPLSSSLIQYPFAARKVQSKYIIENKFVPISDWTPNQIASNASRHYIYGAISELKELVAHLTNISPNFAKFFIKPTTATTTGTGNKTNDTNNNNENTLLPPASIQYSAAPLFSLSEQQNKQDNSKPASSKKTIKMSTTEVNALFEKKGFQSDNLCVKRAVLCGYVKIDDETNEDTVLFSGTCLNCKSYVECTIGQALEQPCYAGTDYVDGGEGGAVKCKNKDCPGMYLTGLCEGNPHLDSGKYHSHCTECKDFGTCMYDYRNAHCKDCGEHYFRGCAGFPCPSCGGGNGHGTKSVSLSDLPPPPTTSWDGKIEGFEEIVEVALEGMNPLEREMMKALVFGPNYTPGNDGSNSFTAMLAQVMMGSNSGDDDDFDTDDDYNDDDASDMDMDE